MRLCACADNHHMGRNSQSSSSNPNSRPCVSKQLRPGIPCTRAQGMPLSPWRSLYGLVRLGLSSQARSASVTLRYSASHVRHSDSVLTPRLGIDILMLTSGSWRVLHKRLKSTTVASSSPKYLPSRSLLSDSRRAC